MSRIEKAIEAATAKRNQNKQNHLATQPESALEVSGIRTMPEVNTTGAAPRTGLAISASVNNPMLVTANGFDPPTAEQYRKLKSMIVRLSQRGNFEKALMVTSSIPGEGKSITSLNLAITMAQELDHSVLLVEADIRKPSLMHYLGLKSDRGLTDCVLDGLDISKVLVKTGIGSLSILPAGRQVDNPVELFSSKRMKALFDEIKTRYNDRYVIVDTTPLLPFAEPTYIANMVGAVIMVVRKGVTPTDKLKSSLEILKDHNLLGVVYNCVSQVNSLHGYYGYYGYHGDR